MGEEIVEELEGGNAGGSAVDIFLTSDGARLAEIGGVQIADALSPMIGQLTKAEVRRLTALLERVLEQPGP